MDVYNMGDTTTPQTEELDKFLHTLAQYSETELGHIFTVLVSQLTWGQINEVCQELYPDLYHVRKRG